MIPPLKELNQLCQKPNDKQVGNWMVRNILRDLALPITWLLLHTSVTANQVTAFSLILAMVGIIFLSGLAPVHFLIGTLLLQVWYLLDHVDGQIARYQKTASLTGRFFDFLTHHLIHGALFFGLSFYGYRLTGSVFWIVWGFATSLAMILFNLINDTKYKTYFEIFSEMREIKVTFRQIKIDSVNEKKSFLHSLFSLAHKSVEIHVVMNILTGAALLEIFSLTPVNSRVVLILFYGLTIPLIVFTKILYLIRNKKIDEGFHQLFQEAITK